MHFENTPCKYANVYIIEQKYMLKHYEITKNAEFK